MFVAELLRNSASRLGRVAEQFGYKGQKWIAVAETIITHPNRKVVAGFVRNRVDESKGAEMNCSRIACLLFLVVAFGTQLNADTYGPKIVLGPYIGKLKIGPAMVATGHRLWGTELVGQDLRGACFDDCDFGEVSLRQCDLRGCTFRRSIMSGLTIDGCTWGENDFSDAVINGIEYASNAEDIMTAGQLKTTWSYKHKNLNECKVPSNSDGSEYDFTEFRLVDTRFDRVSNSRFTKSHIERSEFHRCDLTNCDFNGVVLWQSRFENGKIDLSRFRVAAAFSPCECSFHVEEFVGVVDFSNLNLRGAAIGCSKSCTINIENSTIVGLKAIGLVTGKQLTSTQSFKNGDLSEIKLRDCDVSGTDFSRQILIDTKFDRCDVSGCKFDDAVINGASFIDCKGLTTNQIQSTWNYKHDRMAGVKLHPDILNEK